MIMRRLRFGAVLVGVVLALTGFSRHSSHSHSHSSSGGGCSSSKSHSSSTTSHHHYYNDNNNSYGSSSGSTTGSTSGSRSSTAAPTATGTVVTCAKKGATAATVRVSARAASGSHSYRVTMSFLDAGGSVVDTGSAAVQVYGSSSATVKVPMSAPSDVGTVTRCRVDSVLSPY
ncbi:hypothetical protein OG760_14475 [Streptomyces sp. NBC_00963]|uniref:hypothetical protein n=1 Tax=unclassified Streptomyces TaxID=2593676 RepID=UPI00386CF207|nr:hypothetical protein OG760_14475 [Streptomyces sp. NBC_00963]WSX69169.1 hypothetical protein OG221_22625 [Streptomyces sp. NBC_00932]